MLRAFLSRLAAVIVLGAMLAAAWFPAWATLLFVFVGLERPDPTVPDGDPCCGHPNSCAESATYLGYAALWAVLAAGPLTLASAAAWAIVHGAVPPALLTRRSARVAACWLVAAAAAGATILESG